MKKFVWFSLCLLGVRLAGAAELSVDFSFAPEDVMLTAAGDYTVIGLADGSRVVDEVGAPAIPAKFVNILLPAGAQNVKISASGNGEVLARDVVPYPAQPRSPKSKPRPAFVEANARYATATAWPADVAVYQADQEMQGYRFVSVRVNPLAYVGAEKTLYLRTQIRVTASYDLATTTKAISSKQKSEFEPLVNSLVVNPSDASTFAPAVRTTAPKATLDYLIITSSALSNAFQRLADYRASVAGGSYTTKVLTTNDIGSTYSGADIQAKIRACISNSVYTLGTTMVVLGGDDTIVLDRDCYVAVESQSTVEENMPTDLYYSGLGGSWNADGDSKYGETTDVVDMAWDVVVGRIPVRTETQVTNYLNKVMTYESGSPVTNKIILGGPEAWDTYSGTGRPSDTMVDGHAGFRSTSPAHTYVSDSEAWLRRLYRDGIYSNWPASVGIMCDTITSWDGSTCGDHVESLANTLAAFNRNWTHLMFSGHGAPDGWGLESGEFLQGNAASMTGLTAFVYTDACMTSHFDKNSNTIDGDTYTTEPCLAESFLRNSRVLGGAVAYIGCSRYGWGEPDATPADNSANGGTSTIYAYKFYTRMYETPGRTLGVAFAMHKADMASQCATDEAERWVQFGLNLLGDPALKMPVKDETPTPPSFISGSSFGATANVAVAFSVLASGSPTPALVLQSTTASTGYTFSAGTGLLIYTAPDADMGSRTFTFTASNGLGVATQTVTATVTEGPPLAPSLIWASETNSADFVAVWSPVSTATGYRLDVATEADFSDEGGEAGVLLNEGFDNGTSVPSGWTFTAIGSVYTSAGNFGNSSPSLKLDDTGDQVQTPALSSPTNVSFWIKGLTTDAASALLVEKAIGGVWSTVTNLTASLPTTGTTLSCPLGTTVTNLRFTYTKSVGNLAFDDVRVTGGGTGPTSVFVPGYSNRTVAGTSQIVTGLTSGVTYYFRACAVNATGTGIYSSVASVVTVLADSAPVFSAIPEQSATVGVLFTLGVSGYMSGTPTPVLTLQSTTAASGYSFASGTLSFTPGATGTFAFVFGASNTLGVASATATVAVAAAPVTIPTASIANLSSNSFTVNWTPVTSGTTYQVQVATDTNFTPGGASGSNLMVNAGFETGDTTGWGTVETPYAVSSENPHSGSYCISCVGATSTRDLDQQVGILAADGTMAYVISYWYRVTAGDGSDVRIWAQWNNGAGSGDILQPTSYNASSTEWTQIVLTNVPASGATNLDFEVRTYNGATAHFDDFSVVPVAYGRKAGSLHLDATVAALTYDVMGLTPSTPYYVRARSTGGTWSDVVTATTSSGDVPVPAPIIVTQLPTNGVPMGMQIATTPGITYDLEYTTNLMAIPPVWVQVDSEAGTGGLVTLQDEDSLGIQRFYRVVKP